MNRFDSVEDRYNPTRVEDRVFDYWEEVNAYERTVEHRADEDPFYFLDGPPYTSGAAHMGHAWNKSLKDLYIRYKRMQGYDVYDRPGFDMHGLPIETKVEEELDFESKKDIEAYGVDSFIEDCRAFAEASLTDLQTDFESFGVWMDWENPYRTVAPEYMESAWWAFKQVHERGLVEQGLRSITQCPRCETAIANNEVEYHQVEDPSIYVTFPLTDRDGSLVIWTTTPWTIPANTFVAVDGELTYQAVEVKRNGNTEVLWIAKPCVDSVLSASEIDSYEIIDEVDGEEMDGWAYTHPLADLIDHPADTDAFSVYTADYVEADRTGLVHSAPGHGEEDFQRGAELGLDIFCPVGEDGLFDDRAGPYAGEFVRDANQAIIDDLRDRGYLLIDDVYTHDYGQCWRCDTDIIQIVTDQWFITVTDVKEDLLENIEDSDWYPSWARDNRFRDFVEDAPDWNVSRQRYWGIPIPIWLPPDWDGDMDDAIVVGTRSELAERVDQDVDPESIDLHKPTVDSLTITENGTTFERIPDVFDVWLDSSVASWATLGYPGTRESETAFEELWPAELIIEAHDQTRGWFWSQLGMGTAAFDESPYERVLMHGHALMPDGRAMSKSRNITIAPQEVIEKHGADPMRLFLLSIAARGDDMRVSWESLEEMERRLNILWNVFRFPLPYMAMDDVDPSETTIEDIELEPIDRWLLSRLQTVVEQSTASMDQYAQHEAIETLLEFIVEDVSRYYVQVVRERMWEEEQSMSKLAAYATLSEVLEGTVKLLAPFAPFISEDIYQQLTGDDGHPSIHMCEWPDGDPDRRDPALEGTIDRLRIIEEAGSRARQQVGRKLRWPVRRVVVDADEEIVQEAVEAHQELLANRLNARSVEVLPPGEKWDELSYRATADMSVIGPAFGERASEVMTALNEVRLEEPNIEDLEQAIEDVLGSDSLTPEMVSFEEALPESIAGSEFDGGSIYIDATLTEDIRAEGFAREIIRRVQEMRKELDLEMDEEISLAMEIEDDTIAQLVEQYEELIIEEVRAHALTEVSDGYEEEWDVEEVPITLAIKPLQSASR